MTEPTATFTTEGHKPVLIEDWLPIRELGIESVRERAISVDLPPLFALHVWWARVPLVAAAGVTLTALLPPWSETLLDEVPGLASLLSEVPDASQDPKARYQVWVLRLCGIWGDPVKATAGGTRDFTWKQAFKNRPSLEELRVLHELLKVRWGRLPRVLDPTAGGGTLPYVAVGLGLPSSANDLNPVAAAVLEATLAVPGIYGEDLLADIEHWGSKLVERCQSRLSHAYTVSDPEENVTAYLFAHTVECPRTGGLVPLAPNWWLSKGGDGTALRLVPVAGESGPIRMDFEVVSGSAIDFDPDQGTVSRGDAVSPWDGLVIDSDYIKSEAQAGKMGQTLYAVACWKPKSKGRGKRHYFRAPDSTDFDALSSASDALHSLADEWRVSDVLPDESVPTGNDVRPANYGMPTWRDIFSSRQQLAHGVFVEEWRRMYGEAVADLGEERGRALMLMLGMMQGKALNWNSRMSSWMASKAQIRTVFDRHDLSFKWTFAEFDAGRALYPWALQQLVRSYSGVSRLMRVRDGSSSLLEPTEAAIRPGRVQVSCGSGSNLNSLDDQSVEFVNIDPPYYDNVQYSELSDYFYVWEKRTIGLIRGEDFALGETNKEDEAVANLARFAAAGRRRRELATFDYQQKMQAIFAESRRVLVDDGVMVVWFTHKRAEAWDTLATAMMEAGFTIEASWPVATQSENSLHHAKRNSAKSTIMLVCRKRQSSGQEETFFEDIEVELRQAARQAVEKFEREVGVGGVDLQLATYGPTLSVISRNWPVLSSEPDETGRSRRLRPEEALDVARQEVARLRMQRLVGKDATFDPATDFWLMCWETFQAREFPYDEARKLALGVGHDVDVAIKAGLLKKKSGNVELVNPTTRGRALRRLVDDVGRFERLVDALHFMLVTYQDDKLAAARTWLADSGYGSEQRFLDAVQAAVNAVPRVRTKKGLSLEEAALLEDAVVALFGDEISLPLEAEEKVEHEQMTLGG